MLKTRFACIPISFIDTCWVDIYWHWQSLHTCLMVWWRNDTECVKKWTGLVHIGGESAVQGQYDVMTTPQVWFHFTYFVTSHRSTYIFFFFLLFYYSLSLDSWSFAVSTLLATVCRHFWKSEDTLQIKRELQRPLSADLIPDTLQIWENTMQGRDAPAWKFGSIFLSNVIIDIIADNWQVPIFYVVYIWMEKTIFWHMEVA